MNFFSKLFNLKQNNHNRDTNSDCNNFYLNKLECGLTHWATHTHRLDSKNREKL